MRYLRRENGPGNAEWLELSEYVRVLGGESQKRQRLSYHGDLLNERHSSGDLANVLSAEDFASADFLLYLRGLLPQESANDIPWKSWSALYLRGTPRFLLHAQSPTYAENLTRVLELPSVNVLKERLQERGPRIGLLYRTGFWDYPIRRSDIEKISMRKR